MKKTLLALFAAASFSSAVAHAATSQSGQQEHATLYQQEVRAALIERGWDITQDENGKLVAERLWVDRGGTSGFHLIASLNTFEHLQIDFRAVGKNHTDAAAYASIRTYGRPNKSYLLYPEHALRDPKLTQEYRGIVAEAQSHLGAVDSDKVAVR